MYLPADLSLRAELVAPDDAMMAAVTEQRAFDHDRLFCRLQLISNGEVFELPVGARADVRVSFKQPVFTAKATLETARLHTFLLADEVSEEGVISYQAQEVTDARYQRRNDGISGISFTAKRIGAFSVTVELPGYMSPRKQPKLERIS